MRVFDGYTADAGESPVWNARLGCVAWVDLRGDRVCRSFWLEGTTLSTPAPPWPAFLASRRDGGWLLAARDGLFVADDDMATWTPFGAPSGKPEGLRYNDGLVDVDGRLLIGSMSLDPARPAVGVLYQLDGDGRWSRLLEGLGVVNGLALSRDGRRLYVADSRADRRCVRSFAYDGPAARLGDERVLIDFVESALDGVPDGACVDDNDHYWLAAHGAGALLSFTPAGAQIGRIEAPRTVSKAVFAGPALDHFALTSFARQDDPVAGRLIALPSPRPGRASPRLAF